MKITKQSLKILAIIINVLIIVISTWYTLHLYNIQNTKLGAIIMVLDFIIIAVSIIIPCNAPEYFLFNPKLGKIIYHTCGEFYVDIKGNCYHLYDDKILFKSEICVIHFSAVSSEKELLLKFKNALDLRYNRELKLQEKKDFLYKSDGYLDQDQASKRERILNKIL